MTAPAIKRTRGAARPSLVRGATAFAVPSRIPPMVFAYVVPSLIAVLAVQTWFRGGDALAGGDLAPPVAPGSDYRSHWNQFEAGEGSPTFSIVAFPYAEGLRAFSALGLGEATFQRLWLTVLVAGGVAAVVFLAASFVRSPVACGTAGLVSLLSAYHLTTGFDPLPLAALLTAALLGGLVIRAGSPDPPSALLLAVATLPLGFVAGNPALLALVVGWVGACALLAGATHGRAAFPRLGHALALAVPLALLLNVWWIVPFVQTIRGPVFTERFAAPGVDDWAWTHARASLENVVTLTSSWGWTQPEYYPFSARLERAPLRLLAYLPAIAACCGLVLALSWRQFRWVAVTLAALGLAAVWAIKGLHEPLTDTNRWAYEHLPGFWLFRDPAKVGLVLLLIFSVLVALGIARLSLLDRRLGRLAAVVVVAGTAVYTYPVLTGAVAPDERPLLPSTHVEVPRHFETAASRLDDRSKQGKVVVLPQLDYYQAPTTWGYYGASFLRQLIRRPVIEVLPGGYYRNSAVAGLVETLERRARAGGELDPILAALGARYIVLRRDLDPSFPGRTFTDPRTLSTSLRRTNELRLLSSSPLVEVYEARGVDSPEVYAASGVVAQRADPSALTRTAGVGSDPRLAFVARGDRDVLGAGRAGEATLADVPPEAQVAAVRVDGRQTSVRIAGRVSELTTPTRPFRLLVGDTDVTVDAHRDRMLVSIAAPERRGQRGLTPIALPAQLSRQVGDCNRYDDRSFREVGISATVVRSQEPTVRLQAREHAACVSFAVPHAAAGEPVRVRFDYRGVAGSAPRACLWQVGPNECAAGEALAASPGWHRYDAVIEPRPATTSVRLFLYADGGGSKTSVTEYRALGSGSPPSPLALAAAPLQGVPHILYRKQTPYSFRVSVRGATAPFVLVSTETFAPGWRLKGPSGRPGDVPHFRVNGYANGWRIPWTGSYDLTIAYAPERPARVARLVDLAAVPIAVLLLVLWPRGFRRAGEPKRASRSGARSPRRPRARRHCLCGACCAPRRPRRRAG